MDKYYEEVPHEIQNKPFSSQLKHRDPVALNVCYYPLMIEHFIPQWKYANYFIHWIFFITQTPSWSINFPSQFLILVSEKKNLKNISCQLYQEWMETVTIYENPQAT